MRFRSLGWRLASSYQTARLTLRFQKLERNHSGVWCLVSGICLLLSERCRSTGQHVVECGLDRAADIFDTLELFEAIDGFTGS